MILPADLSLNQLLSAVAILLYAASALLGPQLGVANSRRMLSVAWGTHAWAWVSGLMGIGDSLGPHFGFAPALSVTCWLVMAFYALEQRWVPQVRSRGALGGTRFAHYVASKAAVVGLTRAMAMELRGRQIAVNSVAPGFTDTPMTRSAPPEMFSAWELLEPSGKAASPDEIAHAIAFLASPGTTFITGQTLFVDGGKSLGGLSI